MFFTAINQMMAELTDVRNRFKQNDLHVDFPRLLIVGVSKKSKRSEEHTSELQSH